jgi:hypothetical protein
MAGIAAGRQWSLMTVDEGRVALGLNPIGDSSRLAPVNMMNAELVPNQTEVPNGLPGATPPEPPPAKKPTASTESEAEVEAEPEPETEE